MVLSIMAYSLSASAARSLEHPLPYPALGPAREARMNLDRIAKALRQVPPGNARAIAVEHSFDKQPIVLGRHPNMAFTSRQKILDPVPLVVPKSITSHWSAPNRANPFGFVLCHRQ